MRSHLVLTVIFLLTGCAWTFSSRKDRIDVSSATPGSSARVECAGVSVAAAPLPAKIEVPRKAQHCRVVVTAPGSAEQPFELSRVTNENVWWNFGWGLFGTGATYSENGGFEGHWNTGRFVAWTAVPMLVDYWTGAMYEHKPKKIEAK